LCRVRRPTGHCSFAGLPGEVEAIFAEAHTSALAATATAIFARENRRVIDHLPRPRAALNDGEGCAD